MNNFTGSCWSLMLYLRFFILISEMRRPQDAMKVMRSFEMHSLSSFTPLFKAAWFLQGFSTVFYTVFAIVM